MRRLVAVVVLSTLSVIATGAQSKAPVTRADYGQWESIAAAGPRGGFSPDGQWLAYSLSRSNRNNELRLLKIADGTVKTAAFGTQPAFSADSKWAAYALGYSEAEQERMRTARQPIQNKLGLLNLSSGDDDDRRRRAVVQLQRRRRVSGDAAVSAGAAAGRRRDAAEGRLNPRRHPAPPRRLPMTSRPAPP